MSRVRESAKKLGLTVSEEPIKPGDLYLAQRNTGPHILTCKRVDEGNFIIPEENAYFFDTWECLKIVE